MDPDHSLTYTKLNFRNIAHRTRLNAIIKAIKSLGRSAIDSYADFGSSNGYVTDIIGREVSAKRVIGFDHAENNLELGREKYPHIEFHQFDLNVVRPVAETYALVTCFETLEHVGDIDAAIENILNHRAEDGSALISVPVEIGPVGVAKYLIKRYGYKYDLPLACGDREYFKALMRGEDVSKYREPAEAYGSHFGFDYRSVDTAIQTRVGDGFKAWNSFSTRFYLV